MKWWKKGMIVLIALGVVLIGKSMRKDDEFKEIRQFINEYYSHHQRGEYQEAYDMLNFTEETLHLQELMIDSFRSNFAKSFRILEIKALGDDIYQVSVEGIKMNYEDEEEPFSVTNYVIRVDGSLRFCISARYVPEEIYIFPEGTNPYTAIPVDPDGGGFIIVENAQ